jgi:hypothetical protein
VRLVLERCEGNKRVACELLDISYRTLQTYAQYGCADPRAVGPDRGEIQEIETSTDGPPTAGLP